MNSKSNRLNFSEILVQFYFLTKPLISHSYIFFIRNDLIRKTNANDLISKYSFVEYFDIPTLVAERLWYVLFNEKDKEASEDLEYISKEKFQSGFERIFPKEDNQRDIIKIIFEMYDFDNNSYINQNDIYVLMNVCQTYISKSGNKDYFKRKIVKSDNFNSQFELEKEILKNSFFSNFNTTSKGISYFDFISLIQFYSSDVFYMLFMYITRVIEGIESLIELEFYIVASNNYKQKENSSYKFTFCDSKFNLKESFLVEVYLKCGYIIDNNEDKEYIDYINSNKNMNFPHFLMKKSKENCNKITLFYLKTINDMRLITEKKHHFLPKVENERENLKKDVYSHKKTKSSISKKEINQNKVKSLYKSVSKPNIIVSNKEIIKDLYTKVPMLSTKTEKIFQKYSKRKEKEIVDIKIKPLLNEEYDKFLYLNLKKEGSKRVYTKNKYNLDDEEENNEEFKKEGKNFEASQRKKISKIVLYKISSQNDNFTPITLVIIRDMIFYYKNKQPKGIISLNNNFIILQNIITIGGINKYFVLSLSFLNNKTTFYFSSFSDYKYIVLEIVKFLAYVNINHILHRLDRENKNFEEIFDDSQDEVEFEKNEKHKTKSNYFENTRSYQLGKESLFDIDTSKASDLLEKYKIIKKIKKKNTFSIENMEKGNNLKQSSIFFLAEKRTSHESNGNISKTINKKGGNKEKLISSKEILNKLEEIKIVQSNKLEYYKENDYKKKNNPTKEGEYYLIKVIYKEKLSTKDILTVRREVEVMYCLNHINNIDKIVSVFENENYIYLIYEYIEGKSIKEYMSDKENKFLDNQIINYIRQIILCVMTFRSIGIIHRNINPENLIISYKLNKPIIYITDFSYARIIGHNQVITFESYGSFGFASSEVLLEKNITFKSETYTLGVIFFLMIKRRLPFFDSSFSKMAFKIIECDFSNTMTSHEKYGQFKDAYSFLKLFINQSPNERISLKIILNHDYLKVD